MTKSSEILRLAAEYEFKGDPRGLLKAINETGYKNDNLRGYYYQTGWLNTLMCSEHAVMALCLAAAIAEDAGD